MLATLVRQREDTQLHLFMHNVLSKVFLIKAIKISVNINFHDKLTIQCSNDSKTKVITAKKLKQTKYNPYMLFFEVNKG